MFSPRDILRFLLNAEKALGNPALKYIDLSNEQPDSKASKILNKICEANQNAIKVESAYYKKIDGKQEVSNIASEKESLKAAILASADAKKELTEKLESELREIILKP